MRQSLSYENNKDEDPEINLQEEIAIWENNIETIKEFKKITVDDYSDFINMMSKENDCDSYLTSPVYYAFTGRNGLWVYREGETFIPVCWHPNIRGHVLIYPPRGQASSKIILKLLEKLPRPPIALSIARAKPDLDIESLNKQLIENSANRSVSLTFVQEDVLDWLYPVRVLSTEKVMLMDGPDFRGVRNHIRVAARNKICIEQPTINAKGDLEKFITRWAKLRSQNQMEIDQLTLPYFKLLKLWEDQKLSMHGMLFKVNDKIQAVTFWDVSNKESKTANRYINLCNSKVHGLADFVTQRTAEYLFSNGILFFNIGGSETESLDKFKNKFMPAYSINLRSVNITICDDMKLEPVRRKHMATRYLNGAMQNAA